MVTIKEIANLAEVSTATVSKIINGKDRYISEATRQRVLEIVEREGYIPNGVAKSLKMKKTKTIGIIIPDVMNLFFSELARGIEDAAEKKGYTVILCNSDNKEKKAKKYMEMLQEKMVDGIILTASEKSDYTSINPGNIPTVLLDRDVKVDKKVGRIFVDNKDGAYSATNYLIKKGCKNIAIISSDTKNKPSAERIKGYENALLDNNLSIDEDKMYLDSYTIESGYNGVKEIIKNTEVDGIFCGNDLIAIGVIKALKEVNIRVPQDIKVVGFDDIQISQYIDPPLTTIKQPIYKMGSEAVNMLIGIIKIKDVEKTKVLKTELIKRGSA